MNWYDRFRGDESFQSVMSGYRRENDKIDFDKCYALIRRLTFDFVDKGWETEDSIAKKGFSLGSFLYSFLHFEDSGKKIYKVSQGLSDLLLNTNIKGVDFEMVRCPYKAILLETPPIRVSKDIVAVNILLVDEGDNIMLVFLEDVGEMSGAGPLYDFYHLRKFIVSIRKEFDSVEEGIDDSISVVENNPHLCGKGWKIDDIKEHRDSLVKAMCYAVNILMYITGVESCIKEVDEALDLRRKLNRLKGSKRAKWQRKIDRVPMPYRLLGADIVLSRQEKDIYDKYREETGRKVAVRFTVQGHWRKQAYGEGWAKHKNLWIRPYWKGPEFAEVVNRAHTVK